MSQNRGFVIPYVRIQVYRLPHIRQSRIIMSQNRGFVIPYVRIQVYRLPHFQEVLARDSKINMMVLPEFWLWAKQSLNKLKSLLHKVVGFCRV